MIVRVTHTVTHPLTHSSTHSLTHSLSFSPILSNTHTISVTEGDIVQPHSPTHIRSDSTLSGTVVESSSHYEAPPTQQSATDENDGTYTEIIISDRVDR